MINLFKIIVILSYVIYAVFFFMPYIDIYVLSEETLSVLAWSGYGAIIGANDLIGYLFFSAYTVVLFGLLNFNLWARPLFVVLTILSAVMNGLQGLIVFTALDSVLSYITNIADGATIVLMYFTSISSKFSENT